MAEKEFPKFVWKDKPKTHISMEDVFETAASLSYRPIVEAIYGGMQAKIEGEVVRAAQAIDVSIDEERLKKALQSDRDAYVRGYIDGRKSDMVLCDHCDHFLPCEGSDEGYCVELQRGMPNNGFCCLAERKDEKNHE